MKLTYIQLEAAAYIFEKDNGNKHPDLLEKIILESGLSNLNISDLEKIILDGLNSGIYKDDELRVSAYWALTKRFNPKFIPSFKKWLKKEFDNKNTKLLFQIMIALDNLDVQIFHIERTGFAVDEIELNLRDAKKYLCMSIKKEARAKSKN